jgi:FMN phosphatase YigB (HAD superfamily)
MATMKELELQPGAKEAFASLTQGVWQIMALTNGSEDSTHHLLAQAGVEQYFTQVYSRDAIAPCIFPKVIASNHNQLCFLGNLSPPSRVTTP